MKYKQNNVTNTSTTSQPEVIKDYRIPPILNITYEEIKPEKCIRQIEIHAVPKNKDFPKSENELTKEKIIKKIYLPIIKNDQQTATKRNSKETASRGKPEKKKERKLIKLEDKNFPNTTHHPSYTTKIPIVKLTRDNERFKILNGIPTAVNIVTNDTRRITAFSENTDRGATSAIKIERGEHDQTDSINYNTSVTVEQLTEHLVEMERALQELANREQQLRQRIRDLMHTKARAFQSYQRKQQRIAKYEAYIQMLEAAPDMSEDSDGDEILTNIKHQIERKTFDDYTTIDKFIFTNEADGINVSVTTSTTVRANIPINQLDDKNVKIARQIRGTKIFNEVSASWATKLTKCTMKNTRDEIMERREEVQLRDENNEPITSISTNSITNPRYEVQHEDQTDAEQGHTDSDYTDIQSNQTDTEEYQLTIEQTQDTDIQSNQTKSRSTQE